MKKTLTALLILTALALCGVSVAQWRRESALRLEIDRITRLYQEENQLRVETEQKAAAFEQEIARLTQLRADTEARLLEVTDELTLTRTDQLQRGVSIAVLGTEFTSARARAEAAEQQLTEFKKLIADSQQDVTGQNTAITEANTRLKQLATERDQAIAELNARTKAFNELVEKYNRLVK